MNRIKHVTTSLALHELAEGDGTPLLLLHQLGGSSADWDVSSLLWPGPIYGLDFSGHGRSEALAGGGYTPELFVADADHALARIGSAAVAGAGLGAYVALLLGGARPDLVLHALLLPGAGLAGEGAHPDPAREYTLADVANTDLAAGCDPLVAAVELMVRPPEYAQALATECAGVLLAEDDEPRPPWWEALRELPRVGSTKCEPGTAFTDLLARL